LLFALLYNFIRMLSKVHVENAWHLARILGSFLVFCCAGSAQQLPPGSPPPETLTAKMQATITSHGTLQAAITVSVTGGLSIPYRDAYEGGARLIPTKLYGSFLRSRLARSMPAVKDLSDLAKPVEITFPIREDDFLIPVLRNMPVQLDLLPPIEDPVVSFPEDTLQLGIPGIRREEIVLDIPPNFTMQAEVHLDEDRPFARYKSDATVVGGKLLIIRELELKAATVGSEKRSEVFGFWKVIRSNQQRTFNLRRTLHSDFTEWIQNVPTNRANTYGMKAIEQREYEAARQLLERATQASPNDRFAWNNLGRALAGLGKLEEAEKAYEWQIAVNPNDPYAYNNLGLIYEREGRWDKAIDSLRKQLAINPTDQYGVRNLPRALIHQGRWAEAEEAAARAVQSQPTNALYRVDLATARVCQGKVEDARKEIETALGPRPSGPLSNNAAYYLTECGKEVELAEWYVKRALDQTRASPGAMRGSISAVLGIQSSRGTYLDTYGWLLFKTGKTERAIQTLSSAVALAPRAEIYAHLAQAEWKLGHTDQAAEHWREATYQEPGQLSQVPPEIAQRLPQIPTLSTDREWYGLDAALPKDLEASVRADQPSYFFVVANPDGTVQTARQLDPEDPVAKALMPEIRKVLFPVIRVDDEPTPTANIVRTSKRAGRVSLIRSVGTEAVAIATDLAPGDFPVPVPSAPVSAPRPIP
jgi:tetratricopeptide (TPR) repeat protein